VGGTKRSIRAPTRIASERAWVDVSVSVSHSCATSTDGSLFCWGIGEAGQLGEGSAFRLVPTDVSLSHLSP
jgi:alpha-tubulin suppressor-like RCC1 family protein